ncbi:MAG: hypothetical protein HYZ37_16465 [Candidatus Solibacter usitatus]|nr:hypothetical protein [Candidatus Solibacter usitatus]
MKYKLTCLTPTLVGDGQKLSPIDYMVWKDHVNVLDQKRIFKLLAKGPRLESYLVQLRKAEKLDFASWGGFAQNYAGRRIPLEHPDIANIWNRQMGEHLFIPTFASGLAGAYLPASALKGALHTGFLFSRWSEHASKMVQESFQRDRLPRWPAEPAEAHGVGLEGYSKMRGVAVTDSAAVTPGVMKIYVVRTANLVSRGGKTELGWKQAGRGNVEAKRVDDSTPVFCEMAAPGTQFFGSITRPMSLSGAEMASALRWKEAPKVSAVLEAANDFAAKLLENHESYCSAAGLPEVERSLQELRGQLDKCRTAGNGCLLQIGWGGGFLSKVSVQDTAQDGFRNLLRQLPMFGRSIQSGLPFPKSRRVVFQAGKPAALPGWALLEVEP